VGLAKQLQTVAAAELVVEQARGVAAVDQDTNSSA
jgi:hypothetical protein